MDGGSIKNIVRATELELTGNPAQLRDELEAADVEFSVRQAWEKEGKEKLPLSPADWLMGKRLPEIYSRFFGAEAGRSRDKDGAPSGPCVRFVQACLLEMPSLKRDGTPYAKESIAKAIGEARKPRAGRRGATRRK